MVMRIWLAKAPVPSSPTLLGDLYRLTWWSLVELAKESWLALKATLVATTLSWPKALATITYRCLAPKRLKDSTRKRLGLLIITAQRTLEYVQKRLAK